MPVLPEAQWSNNGTHRQNCRLTGHEDDRLSKLKSSERLLNHCLSQVTHFVPCVSLWNISPSPWKSHHRPQIHMHFLAMAKTVLGNYASSFFQNELKVSEIPWQEGSSLSHSKSSMGWFSCLFKMLQIKKTHTLCLWRWHHLILPWRYEWLHH